MNFSQAATGGDLWKNLFLKKFAIFIGKLQACNFIKNGLQHRCFPLKIAKIFKNTYFEEHLPMAASDFLKQPQKNSEQLLLYWPFLSSDNLLTGYDQLKGHWINLTIFWKLANNAFYAKIRR